MLCCNGADRGSKFALTRKCADFRVVLNHEKAKEQCIIRSSQIRSRHESCWREPAFRKKRALPNGVYREGFEMRNLRFDLSAEPDADGAVEDQLEESE